MLPYSSPRTRASDPRGCSHAHSRPRRSECTTAGRARRGARAVDGNTSTGATSAHPASEVSRRTTRGRGRRRARARPAPRTGVRRRERSRAETRRPTGPRAAVELDHDRVVAADDQQRRRNDARENIRRQVGAAAARDHGLDARGALGRRRSVRRPRRCSPRSTRPAGLPCRCEQRRPQPRDSRSIAPIARSASSGMSKRSRAVRRSSCPSAGVSRSISSVANRRRAAPARPRGCGC